LPKATSARKSTPKAARAPRSSSGRPPARAARASTEPAAPTEPAAAREPRGAREEGALDRYDVALLQELQRDARQSNADLAARIGLSPAPTWRRVRRLEELGVITGYRAEIDRRKIGLGVLAFVRVDTERDNLDATRALEEAIRRLPEVISCHYISGAGTFELQVLVTDLDAYSRWTMDTLFRLPNVKDLHTSFSLGEIKSGAALPLGHLKK
jgi:DNA-binding Lrp family transcriptional regulator